MRTRQDTHKEKLSQHLINEHGWTLQPPSPPKDPEEPQEPHGTPKVPEQGDDGEVAWLRALTEQDGGPCPFLKCKKAKFDPLCRHLGKGHKFYPSTLRKPAGEIMQCLGGIRSHSIRRSYRCKKCEPHMTRKRKRDGDFSG